MTGVWTTWVVVIFRVKWRVDVRWYASGHGLDWSVLSLCHWSSECGCWSDWSVVFLLLFLHLILSTHNIYQILGCKGGNSKTFMQATKIATHKLQICVVNIFKCIHFIFIKLMLTSWFFPAVGCLWITLAYSRCLICVSCSFHVISTYYMCKGSWAFLS